MVPDAAGQEVRRLPVKHHGSNRLEEVNHTEGRSGAEPSGHRHADGHAHGGHSHARGRGVLEGQGGNRKRLAIVFGLVVAYMLAEVVAGFLANSLALLADAGHMLSDAASLGLSLFAMWMAGRPASPQHTYGYYRTEILAALVNGVTLVAIALFIFAEAYQRIGRVAEVDGTLMLVVATGGLFINLASLRLLHAGKSENLNVRGAWLHVLSDALGSIGAIAAGVLIWAFGWHWADPVASVLIGLLVLISSVGLLRETVRVLMEGAPGHIDVDEVYHAVSDIHGVVSVHDLHIWTITSGLVALSIHVVIEDVDSSTRLLKTIQDVLYRRFGIGHTTVQVEPVGFVERDLIV